VWRWNCLTDRTTTHTSGNSSIDTSLILRDVYCGPEVLFETCVAIKFVDDDDDDDVWEFEPTFTHLLMYWRWTENAFQSWHKPVAAASVDTGAFVETDVITSRTFIDVTVTRRTLIAFQTLAIEFSSRQWSACATITARLRRTTVLFLTQITCKTHIWVYFAKCTKVDYSDRVDYSWHCEVLRTT